MTDCRDYDAEELASMELHEQRQGYEARIVQLEALLLETAQHLVAEHDCPRCSGLGMAIVAALRHPS